MTVYCACYIHWFYATACERYPELLPLYRIHLNTASLLLGIVLRHNLVCTVPILLLANTFNSHTPSFSSSADCEIFAGLSVDQDVLLTHGDSVDQLADCCQAVAHSGSLVAAIQHKTLKVYGLQFHPEVDLTDNGADMMRNFLYNVSIVLCC